MMFPKTSHYGILFFVVFSMALLPAPGKSNDLGEGIIKYGAEDEILNTGPRYPLENPLEIDAALSFLEEIEGLKIIRGKTGAVLEGELLSHQDLQKVKTVADQFDLIVNLCTMHPDALEIAARFLHEALISIGISNVELRPVGGKILVTGSLASEEDARTAADLIEAYGLPMVNAIRSANRDKRMVMFEVRFTEINSDAIESLGIIWPTAVGLGDPSGFRVGRMKPSASLEATINTFLQQGQARIISRPRLVCRSGESATFQAGGEIPIPRTNKEGQVTVTWKPYGIILEVSPQVDPSGVIFSNVLSEVSTVDRANAVEGVPGILTRRINTSLTLTEGETIIMSGLINSEDAETVRKFPVLGSIPVIGELFKSKDFQERKSELVVFITPHYAATAN
jgi:pilus assembly protein CpaC